MGRFPDHYVRRMQVSDRSGSGNDTKLYRPMRDRLCRQRVYWLVAVPGHLHLRCVDCVSTTCDNCVVKLQICMFRIFFVRVV